MLGFFKKNAKRPVIKQVRNPKNYDSLLTVLMYHSEQFSFTKAMDVVLSLNNKNLRNINEESLLEVNLKCRMNFQSKFSDLYSVEGVEENYIEITVNIQGIAGIEGHLPDCYAEEYILDNRKNKNAVLSFLDIFNNRILSLRYAFYKKHVVGCLSVSFEESVIGNIMSSLSGFGFKESLKTDLMKSALIPQQFKISTQNGFWRNTRSAYWLKVILSGFFEVKIDIEQFFGGFTESVSIEEQTCIGKNFGIFNSLGKDALLGNKIWDQADGIKIIVGPLSFKDYVSFLPKESRMDEEVSKLRKMKEIIRMYVPIEIKVAIIFKLGKEYVDETLLNRTKRLNKDSFILGAHIFDSACFTEYVA